MDRPEPGPSRGQWDAYAEQARKQLPAAPDSLLNGYVQWAPWIAMFFGVIGLLGSLALMGILTVLGPLLLLGGASGIQSGASAFLTLAVGVVLSVVEIAGGYLMRKRSLTGWWILAFGIALGVVTNLFQVAILGLIISLAVAYVHLHVKLRYA
jgi:hypothetical protein